MKIKELELFTPRLEEQTKFYSEVLALDVIHKTNSFVSFQIGHSVLKLIHREEFVPYHYALNIPANQEQEALEWLKERVNIIPYEGLEIQHFEAWNARAIYYYDADGNIGELIARKNLHNESDAPFNKNSLLEICEIGMPTFDIAKEYSVIKNAVDLPIHSGTLERFCSIGDDNGLFIALNKDLKDVWFPTNNKPLSADFRIKFNEKGEDYVFDFLNEELKIVT